MALSKNFIPALSECLCQVCVEILIEPVTLPCSHTLCNPCFRSLSETENLSCPLCHRLISSWARYHSRKNSLVNMELWQTIQKHYPEQCSLRLSGMESEKSDENRPVPKLSEPGELRREYEEELSKMEADRRAQQEEENKLSEEYILKLLAEEEEEEIRQTEKRQKEIEEQVKNDEEIARVLSLSINFGEEAVLASYSTFRSGFSDPVTSTLQNESTSEQENIENILIISPPTSPGESTSQSTTLNTVEIEVTKLPVASDTRLCVVTHEEPKASVPGSTEAAVKPSGKRGNGCCVTDEAQLLQFNAIETENEESRLLTTEDNSKWEHQEFSFETKTDKESSSAGKRRKLSPPTSSSQEKAETDTTPPKEVDSEHHLSESSKED